MKFTMLRAVLAAVVIALVAGVPSSFADTIYLRLSDDMGHSVTISDASGDPLNSSTTPGVITYKGSIGDWNIDVSTGKGSLDLGPGILGLKSVNTSSSGTTSTLTIAFTQTDMSDVFPGWQLNFGGTAKNADNVSYSAYEDNSNTQFGMGPSATLLGTVGPFFTSSFSGSATYDPITLNNPYSLTQVINVTGLGGTSSSFSGNATLTPVPAPEPASIVLLGFGFVCFGLIGRRAFNSLP